MFAKTTGAFTWIVIFLMLASCAISPEAPPEARKLSSTALYDIDNVLAGTLKVLSLNVAHGRKDGINQLLLGEKTFRRNLNDIAAVLKQTGADIVALQEADGPSRWSGGFDHVFELAQLADYPWHCRAGHARSWLFDYGTALLSRGYFVETLAHSFAPTPPTLTKGFLLGQIAWRPRAGSQTTLLIDIISVHLDFSRSKVRQQQITEISEKLAGRNNPVIVLGDFNSEWLADESVVAELARQSGLHSYQPEAVDLGTYKSGQRRLDWILISNELEFISYAVLPDILSDHYAVVAELGLKVSADISAKEIDLHTIVAKPCNGNASCNNCE